MSNDPHLSEDQADPKLAAHYARKRQPPSSFYLRVAKEVERLETTGESRSATCVICGNVSLLDPIAFAVARMFTEELVSKGQKPLTPAEVGFTCGVDCHAEKRRRQKAIRDGEAKHTRRHYTEEVDDAV